jgi:hypothetical protein
MNTQQIAGEVRYLREQVEKLSERIGTLEEVFVLHGLPPPRDYSEERPVSDLGVAYRDLEQMLALARGGAR